MVAFDWCRNQSVQLCVRWTFHPLAVCSSIGSLEFSGYHFQLEHFTLQMTFGLVAKRQGCFWKYPGDRWSLWISPPHCRTSIARINILLSGSPPFKWAHADCPHQCQLNGIKVQTKEPLPIKMFWFVWICSNSQFTSWMPTPAGWFFKNVIFKLIRVNWHTLQIDWNEPTAKWRVGCSGLLRRWKLFEQLSLFDFD